MLSITKIKEKHKLKKPSGSHLVGCTNLMFEYTQVEDDSNKRVIPCLCFYPAKHADEKEIKKYVSEHILPGSEGIETNSYLNAPIYEGKHPLILFNHGYCMFLEANTVQCEELASHGYIVLSIGHQGEGSYLLPDGEVSTIDAEMQKDFLAHHSKSNEIFPAYSDWLINEGNGASLEEHYAWYKEIMDSQPTILAHMNIWIKDSLFALEMILNNPERHSNWIGDFVDKDQIGSFGMSFGGAAAIGLTHLCDGIKASANLDGFYYNSTWSKPFQKPTLQIQHESETLGSHLMFPFLISDHDAYLVTVKQSTHANFTDYTEVMYENEMYNGVIDGKEVEFGVLGDILPDKMETIMNTFLLEFFNKYLKNKPAPFLDTDDWMDDVIIQRKKTI
ncbi:hypothetical protein I6N90_00600 [Paenibacillus sp. GSMTC-2017]|uniref:alpha/beta hydrolase n=1 Tax=Paenibacillus sp. GSMTC-2017 TaxID=2794350 RepID=UPI0018D81F08|nr:hypothetical protein [Paenibacillus sp. GSMTC-2017]MBH5316306.1 hypothetical protein [Paenibacillus sp. GSMTC-2017]